MMKFAAESLKDRHYVKTRFAILWTNLINEPFAQLYSMLPHILRRVFEAPIFQIALFQMLCPVVSLFSFYWSADLKNNKAWLRSNVVLAGVLARLPFLFFPIISSAWYLIFSGLIYILFTRACVPAWMEILKLNLPKSSREKLFSLGWTLGYVEGILIGLGIGAMLDAEYWKLLFFASALLGMLAVYLQSRVPIRGEESFSPCPPARFSLEGFLRPWRDSYELMRSRPDFALFQWSFMAGGFGVMLVQPVLPYFYIDVLNLSFLKLGTAITICKGVGIVLTSSIWARSLTKHSLNHLAGVICIGFALFPLCLILAPWTLFWIYFAYLLYGIAQAGSHLLWHLSGPLFASSEESSRFTAVNIIMVGMRGLIAPIIGGILCRLIGPKATLFTGSLFCLYGAYLALRSRWSVTVAKPTH